MFTATKNRQADKDGKQPPVSKKKRLSRADRRQIEAAIARANRTDRKEKSAQDSIPYPAGDRVSHKPLWATEAGLLAAGQSPGFEICNSGFGLRLKRHPLPLAERVFNL